ncbi:MAG: glycosyltransferase [Pigmentiphaga sp.]|nr:glycosyltransferase [Pigmentiphaga sp.]
MSWLVVFIAATVVTGLIVVSQKLHVAFSGDNDPSKPQQVHVGSTPRVGGLAIWVGVLTAYLLTGRYKGAQALWDMLLLCSLPVVLAGFVEDITKRISAGKRLVAAFASAALFWLWSDQHTMQLGIPGIDWLLAFAPISFFAFVIAIAGATHAFNLIDGFNGLASGFAVLVAGSMALVAYQVGDLPIMAVSASLGLATLGFLVWNFPLGKIFLGDGGAYFLGFMLAELAVMLVIRNPGVSTYYAFLVVLYPVVETLVSIWRRKVHRGVAAGQPDALHLHQLIYWRLVRFGLFDCRPTTKVLRNSATAPYLWVLSLICMVPATLYWYSTPALVIAGILFVLTYLSLYKRLLRWRRPAFLVIRGEPAARKAEVKADPSIEG